MGMNMRDATLTFLESDARRDMTEAEMWFQLMANHPCGVGEHSNGDWSDNAKAMLDQMVDANDRLEMLAKIRELIKHEEDPKN